MKFFLLGALVFFLGFTTSADSGVRTAPRSLTEDQIAATISALPNEVPFTLSGLGFFKGKLYISSNIGLVVLSGGRPEKSYQWFKEDDVVEGPWVDVANGMLWIQHVHADSLFAFDGSSWHQLASPVPNFGLTRGDVLAGTRGFSSPSAFWLVRAGHVWRFERGGAVWLQEPDPPAPEYSATLAVAALPRSLLYIVREGLQVLPPSKYAVYNRADKWARRNLSDKMDFGEAVTTAEGTYVRAKDGRLFLAHSEKIEVIKTPGQCEAITQTSDGRLLASFVNQGIFLFRRDIWELKAPYPYRKSEGEHWAYLAEWNEQIAYATSSVPQIQANGTFSESGSVAVWIAQGGKLKRVRFN